MVAAARRVQAGSVAAVVLAASARAYVWGERGVSEGESEEVEKREQKMHPSPRRTSVPASTWRAVPSLATPVAAEAAQSPRREVRAADGRVSDGMRREKKEMVDLRETDNEKTHTP